MKKANRPVDVLSNVLSKAPTATQFNATAGRLGIELMEALHLRV